LETPVSLYSFTPTQGNHAGVEYVFPYITSEKRELDIPGNGRRPFSEGVGSILAWGQQPMNPAGGIITVTLCFTPNLLLSRGWPKGNLADIESAKMDFSESIFNGGEGTLKEVLPSGTTWGKGGQAINYRSTPAIVHTSPSADSSDAVSTDIWEFQVQFYCRTASWANYNNSGTLIGYCLMGI
jgi:hypothetical protein